MFFSSLLKLWLIRSFVFRISVIKNSFVFVNIYSLTRTLHCLFFNVQSPELALIKGTFILYHLSSSLSSTFFIFFEILFKMLFSSRFHSPALSDSFFILPHTSPFVNTFLHFSFPFFVSLFCTPTSGGSLPFLYTISGFSFFIYQKYFSSKTEKTAEQSVNL